MLLFYLIALKITSLSPRFRRFFWRQSYQHLARKYPATFWTFMNYGYAPSAKESPQLPYVVLALPLPSV